MPLDADGTWVPVRRGQRPEPPPMPPTRLKPGLRNQSSAVFRFGGAHDVASPQERWCTNVAAAERLGRLEAAARQKQRNMIKQMYLHEIEEHRWNKMGQQDAQYERLIAHKNAHNQHNAHSVGYNPITLAYLPSKSGERLQTEDREQQRRAAVKALAMHIQRNTFNPITGEDVIRGASSGFRGDRLARESSISTIQPTAASTTERAVATLPVRFVAPNPIPEATTRYLASVVQSLDG